MQNDQKKFRFYQTENHEFVWTDDERYKISYSNPQMQAFDYEKPVKTIREIQYFYYDLEIAVRNPITGEWEPFSSVRSHDFPQAEYLGEAIKTLITDQIKTGAQRYPDKKHEEYTYFKSQSLTHPLQEDFYDIRRYHYTGDKSEWYEIYIGTFDTAVLIQPLCEDDLWALYDCAEKFIKYCIEIYNIQIQENPA
ncbi:MAG: hypothetical protein IJ642_02355 [Oscillospiraceae bacterium]|nr:hypothetical protein [Oscillospiraceae bacterium]